MSAGGFEPLTGHVAAYWCNVCAKQLWPGCVFERGTDGRFHERPDDDGCEMSASGRHDLVKIPDAALNGFPVSRCGAGHFYNAAYGRCLRCAGAQFTAGGDPAGDEDDRIETTEPEDILGPNIGAQIRVEQNARWSAWREKKEAR